jgi:shikimate dehydrogenase
MKDDPMSKLPEPNAAIAGDTRVYAIVGDPIAQARSPLVFNALFRRLGARAVLVPLQVPADQLDTVFTALKAITNLDGVVVTVPHKVALASRVDALGPAARRVGAINCMRPLADGRWIGEMFDGEGFVAGLRREGLDPRGLAVHLAGAGGAGRAVAHALAEAGVARLDLADVDAARRDALLAELAAAWPALRLAAGGDAPDTHDLAVNATPCGMAGDLALPFRVDALPAHAVVADLVMKPEITPLLQRAGARGLRIHLGRHLLDNQAGLVAGFFGLQPMPGFDPTDK